MSNDKRFRMKNGGYSTEQIQSTKSTIGGLSGTPNFDNASFLAGTSTAGIGIDPNEIIGNASGGMYVYNSDGLYLRGGYTTEGLFINSSGQLGVGTNTPAVTLHVYSGTVNQAARFQSTDNNTNIVIQDNDTTGYISTENGTFSFGANSGANNGNLNIKLSDGSVGIGTAGPTAKLEVTSDVLIGNKGGAVGQLAMQTATNEQANNYIRANITMTRNKNQVVWDNTNDEWDFAGGTSTDWSMIAHHSDGLRMYTGQSQATATSKSMATFLADHLALTITTAQRVGIGTTNPAAKLEVVTGAGANDPVNTLALRRDTASDYSAISFRTGGTTNWSVGHNSNGHFEVYEGGAAASTRMSIADGGNVGIGTLEPKGKLHTANGTAGSYTTNAAHDDVIIEGSGNTGINIFSPNTSYQYLAFGDPEGSNSGYVRYYHGANQMVLRAAGNDVVQINSGRVDFDISNVPNKIISANATVTVEATEAQLQIIAADSGTWASNLVLTNAPASGTNRHWVLHHNPSTNTATNETGALGFVYQSTNTNNAIGGDGAGTNALLLQTNGQVIAPNAVGIGTTSISRQQLGSVDPMLHVHRTGTSGSYDLVARFQGGSDLENTGGSILINHSNDRGLLIEAGRGGAGTAADDDAIAHLGLVGSGGANTRVITLRQNDDGAQNQYQVGVGTTAPDSKMHIFKSVGNAVTEDVLKIETVRSDFTTIGGSAILFQNQDSNNSPNLARIKVQTSNTVGEFESSNEASNNMVFSTSDGGTIGDRVIITGTGKVGIGTMIPNVKLASDGQLSILDRKLSVGILDLLSSGTPTQFKIITNIPYASGSADFTVNIKGFRYGSAESADLSVHWHYYNNTFYNANAKSSGSFAPTIKLGVENSKVVIHLASPGYWPKMYVESVYSSSYRDSYSAGWTWSDSAISSDASTPIVTVPYKSNFGNSIIGNSTGLGIGGAPDNKLYVAGNVTQLDGSPEYHFATSSASHYNWRVAVQEAQDKGFEIASGTQTAGTNANSDTYTNRFIIMGDTGRVGIGAGTPTYGLHVNNPNTSNSGAMYVAASLNSSGKGLVIDSTTRTTNDNAVAAFQIINRAGGYTMTSTVEGQVGIGTSIPSSPMHVYSAGANPTLLTLHNYLSDISGSGNQGGNIDFKMTDDNATATPQVRIGMRVYDNDGGDAGIPSEGAGNFVIETMDPGSNTGGAGTLSEKMRVTEKGNVGIGTATPSARIHSYIPAQGAGLRLQANGSYIDTVYQTTSGDSFLQVSGTTFNFFPGSGSASDIPLAISPTKVHVANSHNLHVDGGSVGIGSASPAHALDVVGNGRFQGTGDVTLYINADTDNAGGEAQHPEIRFGQDGFTHHMLSVGSEGTAGVSYTNTLSNSAYVIGGNGHSGTIPLHIGANNIVRMTILPNGRIGIGTNAPQKEQDFIGSANDFVTMGAATSMSVGSWSGIHFGYRENGNSLYRKSAIVFERTDLTANDAQGKLHILNGPQGSSASATLADAKITIAENGDVGIGTSSPSEKFEVFGTAGQLFSITDSLSGTLFSVNDGSGIPSIEVDDTGQVRLAEFAGNVLVGTNTDDLTNKLQVDGGIMATGDVTAYASSDARLKTNLETIDNALTKVDSLTGYTFNWNENARGKDTEVREAGIIAQDVEAVLPEVVTTRDDGYMAVKYEKLVPLLIEAIKDLKAEIEELKRK